METREGRFQLPVTGHKKWPLYLTANYFHLRDNKLFLNRRLEKLENVRHKKLHLFQ